MALISCTSGSYSPSYNYPVTTTVNSQPTPVVAPVIPTALTITNNPKSTFKYNPIENTAEVTITFKGNVEKGLFELQLRKPQSPLQSFIYGTMSLPCDFNYPYNVHQTYEGNGDGSITLKSSYIPDGNYIPYLIQYSSCCKNDMSCHPVAPIGNGYALSDVIEFKHSFKGDFKDISFIHFYGDVDKEKIMNLIYSINYSYFEGVTSLDIIKTKFNILQNAGVYTENALYIPIDKSRGQIRWYIENEDNQITKHDILHELKHHYCWINGDRWNSIEEAHQGCFLNTPIDKEYNSNKEFGFDYIK